MGRGVWSNLAYCTAELVECRAEDLNRGVMGWGGSGRGWVEGFAEVRGGEVGGVRCGGIEFSCVTTGFHKNEMQQAL